MMQLQVIPGQEAGFKNVSIKNAATKMSGIFYSITEGL